MSKTPDIFKDRTYSIWDVDIDWKKVAKLSPEEKHRLFPNDFAPDGEPYGDF